MKKILVIGASVAGPAVCYWLKKFGFSPTLIERNSAVRKGGFAIDVRGVAVNVVKKMGIYEKITDKRTQLEYGHYVDAQGNILHEEQGEKLGFKQKEEVEIARGDLVEILMQSIKDIPCYFGEIVEKIKQYNDYVQVTFKEGKTENYDLVIGADGLHSPTRRKVFTQDEYELIDLESYLSVFSIPNYLKLKQSEIHFEIDQKFVHMNSSMNPDVAFAGFMCRSDYKLDEIRSEKEQKKFLIDTFFDIGWEANKLLQLMEESKDFYFDRIMQVKMQSWSKGRVVLLGDAGYCASPLSGQGTSLALVGAYILAQELKVAGENYSSAFERYNTLLHPFVDANQSFGVWASKTFLLPEKASKEAVEARTNAIMEKMQIAANAIKLPEYV